MLFLRMILIAALLTTSLYAEESEKKSVVSSIGADLASPFTTPARWILIGGTLTTAMMYLTREDINYRKRDSFKSAQPLGKLGTIGDLIGYGLLNVGYSAYFLYDGKMHDNEKSMRAFEHMMRASTYTLAVTTALKHSISEKRPGYPDDDNSFPSGHSSASFAFASVVALQHGWLWGSVAHAGAAFIAISRANDDFHYLHDITAGITIGASFAWGVYYNLEKGNPYWFSAIPVKGGAGLALGYEF